MEIIFELAINVFIAAGGTALGFLYQRYRKYVRFRKFQRVFGRNVEQADDVSISVPLWMAMERSRSDQRFIKQDIFGNKEYLYGPSEMYNREDMIAAAFAINILGRYFPNQVNYVNDSEELAWNRRSIILIGAPTSNYHSRFALAQIGNDVLSDAVMFEEIDEAQHGSRCRLRHPKSGETWQSDHETDYGLVMRVRHPSQTDDENFVFFVAGIHAESTREAGRMFSEFWKTLDGEEAPNGLVFRMLRGVAGTGQIVFKF